MTDPDPFPRLPPAPGMGGSPPPPPPFGGGPPSPVGPPVYGGGAQYGAPPYQQPIGGIGAYGWSPGPALPQRNGMAIAALVLGLVSVLLFWLGIFPLLALIFGLIGASRAKSSNGAIGGLGQARAGWILGVLGLAGFVAIVAAAANGNFDDKTDVFELEVGRCYDLPAVNGETTVISSLEDIPCTEPHNGELIFQGELNPDRDREYPDDFDALLNEAGEQCLAPFETYVGTTYSASELQIYPIVSNELGWRATRGQFSCFVSLEGGRTMTASVKGSGR